MQWCLITHRNNFIFLLYSSETVKQLRSICDSFVSVSSHCCVSHRNPELCRHKNVVGCHVFPQSRHTRLFLLLLSHRRTLLPSQRSAAMMHSSAEATSGMLVHSRYSSDTQAVSYINTALLYRQQGNIAFEVVKFGAQH
jgi:hypothetical protein